MEDGSDDDEMYLLFSCDALLKEITTFTTYTDTDVDNVDTEVDTGAPAAFARLNNWPKLSFVLVIAHVKKLPLYQVDRVGTVGEGMLTAAIIGDVFASPIAEDILAGIRAVTGPIGCLLIVKKYIDECLNFGLAAEMAMSEGFNVEMVTVADDVFDIPNRGIRGRRGLAGTILVQKVAGVAGASGRNLNGVHFEAWHASRIIRTYGIASTIFLVPCKTILDAVAPAIVNLGIDIRGEKDVLAYWLNSLELLFHTIIRDILLMEDGSDDDETYLLFSCDALLKEITNSFCKVKQLVAGVAGASGRNLNGVHFEAWHASRMIRTYGIASTIFSVPCKTIFDAIAPKIVNLGIGIVCRPFLHCPNRRFIC